MNATELESIYRRWLLEVWDQGRTPPGRLTRSARTAGLARHPRLGWVTRGAGRRGGDIGGRQDRPSVQGAAEDVTGLPGVIMLLGPGGPAADEFGVVPQERR